MNQIIVYFHFHREIIFIDNKLPLLKYKQNIDPITQLRFFF